MPRLGDTSFLRDMPRIPNDSERLVILGATGSGKTQAGVWHLSNRSFDLMPWVVYDFKRDGLLDRIGATEIPVDGPLPNYPGLYIVRPHPDDIDYVDTQIMQAWNQGDTGIYIDEGYMLNRSKAYRTVLTQGRAINVPVIVCSQRPAFIDTYTFTEASFFQVFRLQAYKDIEKVVDYVPILQSRIGERRRQLLNFDDLKRYESFYYDVGENRLWEVDPVPDEQTIIDTFETRLAAMGDPRAFV